MKYVAVDENSQHKVIDLQELYPTWTVVGEISYEQEDEDDPLVALVNPLATPDDFMWPENMFDYSTQVRLSALIETIKIVS